MGALIAGLIVLWSIFGFPLCMEVTDSLASYGLRRDCFDMVRGPVRVILDASCDSKP